MNHLKDVLAIVEKEGLLGGAKTLTWAKSHLADLLKTTSNLSFWEAVCRIAKWIVENPNSNVYLREIPVDVSQEFIEDNKALIHSLTSGKPIRISFESDHRFSSLPKDWLYEYCSLRKNIRAKNAIDFYKQAISALESLEEWIQKLPTIHLTSSKKE